MSEIHWAVHAVLSRCAVALNPLTFGGPETPAYSFARGCKDDQTSSSFDHPLRHSMRIDAFDEVCLLCDDRTIVFCIALRP